MSLLDVKSRSKTYGKGEAAVHALKKVSFTVPKGEYVAIEGEAGSGKSTLLNMIGAFSILLDLQKPDNKYLIMITHRRSMAQTAGRVLQVSDGVLTDLGRCWK